MRVTTKVTGSVYQGFCASGVARRVFLKADIASVGTISAPGLGIR
jgi:hypothetical protein